MPLSPVLLERLVAVRPALLRAWIFIRMSALRLWELLPQSFKDAVGDFLQNGTRRLRFRFHAALSGGLILMLLAVMVGS